MYSPCTCHGNSTKMDIFPAIYPTVDSQDFPVIRLNVAVLNCRVETACAVNSLTLNRERAALNSTVKGANKQRGKCSRGKGTKFNPCVRKSPSNIHGSTRVLDTFGERKSESVQVILSVYASRIFNKRRAPIPEPAHPSREFKSWNPWSQLAFSISFHMV